MLSRGRLRGVNLQRKLLGHRKDGSPIWSAFKYPGSSSPRPQVQAVEVTEARGKVERFYCVEPNCEQEWTGVEAELKTKFAIHLGEQHGYDIRRFRIKISPTPVLKEDDSAPEPEHDKLSPDDPKVNLRYATDPLRSCGQCANFSLPGACRLVLGAIRAVDSCNLWEQAAHPMVNSKGEPTGARGPQESIRAFESSYGESSTLPKARNDADKDFSVNETVEALRSSGWYLADHDKEVAVFRHPLLRGHTLAIRGQRWEHRDEEGALVARHKVGMLSEYAEVAPGALGMFTEAVKSFLKSYDG